MVELQVDSIGKLINDVNMEDLRNAKEMDNLLKVLKEKKLNLLIEKEKIKEALAMVDIKCFVAHDGYNMPEKVKIRIINELDEFNAFIPVLSDNFKNSDYCSQEVGVAYFKDLLIIPLSADGMVPYGFISGFRSPAVNENNIPLDHIIKLIADYYPEANIKGKLINALKEANSFRNAEDMMKNLKPYFDKLCDEEVNTVIDISIENNQVHAANLCRNEYLPEFIENNRDKIEKDKLKAISEIIKEEDELKN